jgi:hypothetical protein
MVAVVGKKWEERRVTSSAEAYRVVPKWAAQRQRDFRTSALPHFCQGEGRGFESRRPLAKNLLDSYFGGHSRFLSRAVTHGLPTACPSLAHGSMVPRLGAPTRSMVDNRPSTYLTLSGRGPGTWATLSRYLPDA